MLVHNSPFKEIRNSAGKKYRDNNQNNLKNIHIIIRSLTVKLLYHKPLRILSHFSNKGKNLLKEKSYYAILISNKVTSVLKGKVIMADFVIIPCSSSDLTKELRERSESKSP